MKLVAVLERKILIKRFDFWLPLKRHAQNNNSSSITYDEPTLMKMQINEKYLEDEKACEELIKNYNHKVTLKKISNVSLD